MRVLYKDPVLSLWTGFTHQSGTWRPNAKLMDKLKSVPVTGFCRSCHLWTLPALHKMAHIKVYLNAQQFWCWQYSVRYSFFLIPLLRTLEPTGTWRRQLWFKHLKLSLSGTSHHLPPFCRCGKDHPRGRMKRRSAIGSRCSQTASAHTARSKDDLDPSK